MTIKEIENLTGMTRANIRFYEKEGFLIPDRLDNGYRDYTEENARILKKIKLLRSLGVSIEEIRLLEDGAVPLDTILKNRLESLQKQKKETETSDRVCREICDSHENFQTLDSQKYLDSMNRIVISGPGPALPETDRMEPVEAPFRRLVARIFDLYICGGVLDIILMIVFSYNLNNADVGLTEKIIFIYARLVVMLFAEPLMLCLLGTTPGKWAMGLSVTGRDGKKITYAQGLERTFKVIRYGMGFGIPVYDLYRYYTSYKAVKGERYVGWDDSDEVQLKDIGKTRLVVLAAEIAIVYLVQLGAAAYASLPPNRGKLTTAEFCENYNRQEAFFGMDTDQILDDRGNWITNTRDGIVVNLSEADWPELEITETDGAVTSVCFTYETEDPQIWPDSYRTQMELIMMSLAAADKNYGIFYNRINHCVKEIAAHPYESFVYNDGITEVNCEVTYSGYIYDSEYEQLLVPDEGPVQFRISFELNLLK